MVNGISFNGGYTSKVRLSDVENVVKFTTGTTIVNEEENPFGGAAFFFGIPLAMEGFKGGKWAWTNRKDLKGAWANYKQTSIDGLKEYNKAGGYKTVAGNKIGANGHVVKTFKEMIPSKAELSKLSPETQAMFEKTRKTVEFAEQNPKQAKRAFKVAEKRLAQARAAAHAEKMATPATGFAKVGRGISKYTGISKLNGALKNLATKSPFTAKVLRYGKGNGLFLGIMGAVELFTQVIPAFGLGADKGAKQIVKSTVNTGASIGGWIAGAAVGGKAGAAVGAAIGSIVPGIGNAVGAAVGSLIGMAGGCLGSWLAGKAAKVVTGKSEVEKAQEAQAKQLAEEAAKDPKLMSELLETASQKIKTEGTDSEDAKVAFASLTKLAKAAEASTPNTFDPYSFKGDVNYSYNQNSTNPFSNADYMDKDFMAMGAGLA